MSERRSAPAKPSGAVSSLFTDVEDSTRRWEPAPDQMRLGLGRWRATELFTTETGGWNRRGASYGHLAPAANVAGIVDQKRNSLLGIVASVAIGALVILAGSDGSSQVGSLAVFALCGVLSYVINWIAFVPANIAQTEHYFDLTGSLTYLSLTAVAVVASDEPDARSLIVAVMVAVWALRLGTFLLRRVKRDGRDGRFDRIKVDPLRFFMTWTVQALWVLLTLACALAIITGRERQSIGWVAVIGILVWVAGFTIEVVADRQKSAFKQDPANDGRFITSGLWAWSRHPNYFGEITLWVGVAIMALPVLSGWRWAMLISPVFVALLLIRGSGIPLLEARAEKRWGADESFRAYTRDTPALLPRPPRS